MTKGALLEVTLDLVTLNTLLEVNQGLITSIVKARVVVLGKEVIILKDRRLLKDVSLTEASQKVLEEAGVDHILKLLEFHRGLDQMIRLQTEASLKEVTIVHGVVDLEAKVNQRSTARKGRRKGGDLGLDHLKGGDLSRRLKVTVILRSDVIIEVFFS